MARAKYNRQLSDYCALYHVSLSGLNKLVARGKRSSPPELPPFDRPELMAEWYGRHYKHLPPPRLVELAEGPPSPEPGASSQPGSGARSGRAPSSVSFSGAPSPSAPAAPQRVAIDMASLVEMDLSTAAAMQRKKVAAEWQAYDAAQKDPSITQQALKTAADRYDCAITTLATIEAKVTEAEIKRGERPLLNDVRAELAPIIVNIKHAFLEVLMDRVGISRDRAHLLADDCFRDLVTTRFSPAPVAA